MYYIEDFYMKISLELFKSIESNFGSVASWALWESPGETPKSNIGDMDILDPNKNPNLLECLNPNVVMVGLNFSRTIQLEKAFQNFHDKSPYANDFKIRYAFENSPYYGAYMTDIIKNLEMVSSNDVLVYLKSNPTIIMENIEVFKMELKAIGSNKPLILALGSDAFNILYENLDNNLYSHLIKITHYSHRISKEAYRDEVHSQINNSINENSYFDFLVTFDHNLDFFISNLEKIVKKRDDLKKITLKISDLQKFLLKINKN